MMGGVTRDVLNRLGRFKKLVYGTLENAIIFEEIGINAERLRLLQDSARALKDHADYMIQQYETIEHRDADGDNRGVQSRFNRQSN